MRTILYFAAASAFSLTLACKANPSGETESDATTGTTSTTTVTTATTSESTTTSPTTSTTTVDVTTTTTTATTTTGEPTTTTGTSSTTGGVACIPIECEGTILACGDCMDNDGDGKVDLADPECVTPCDDREDTFSTGLPGDNMDPCNQDCFFDGNSGAGDDKCNWSLKCDPMSPGGDICPYDENFKNCPDMQDPACAMNCQVPNNCDCFGCCTVTVDGMSHDIFLGDPDCTLADIDKCQSCTKNDDCDEECHPEQCEVCFGETEPPPGCEDPTCDGKDPCTIDMGGNSDCPEGYYCQTGCCFQIIPG